MNAEEPVNFLLDVPPDFDDAYRKKDKKISCRTGLLIMSGSDRDVKRPNNTLSGTGSLPDNGNPGPLFMIYSPSETGACIGKPGLVSRFGNDDILEQGIMITGATCVLKPLVSLQEGATAPG